MWEAGFLVLLAMLGGIAVTFQGQFMGLMEQAVGSRMALFVTFSTGGLAMMLFTLLSGGTQFYHWKEVPWYATTTGLRGIVIVGSIGYVGPRMGLATGFTLIIAAQLVSAALIDHFGWFGTAVRPIDGYKILGLIAMVVAVRLLTR
ncbi:MAG: DMT family transporter [Cyanobacteria bacterium P01_D01_bin.128]